MKQAIKLTLLSVFMLPMAAKAENFIVKYKEGQRVGLDFSNVEVLDHNSAGNLVLVDVPNNEEGKVQVLSSILSSPSVDYMVKNIKLETFTRNQSDALQDIFSDKEWSDAHIKAPEAVAFLKSKGLVDKDKRSPVTIAIIDTGVDLKHPALAPNMDKELSHDFLNNDSDPDDEVVPGKNPGHGTHVAGIIGATGLISEGVTGVHPNVTMAGLKFLGGNGQGDLFAAIKAIDHSIENKVDIISASWGAEVEASQATPLIEAVQRVEDAGILFIVAAGNSSKSNDKFGFYPANVKLPHVITVAASNPADGKPQWSNYGFRNVDISAPGENIYSTIPNSGYMSLSGTSMATPVVSGLAALILSANPDFTGPQVKAILQYSAAKVDIEVDCECRVDALASVERAVDPGMFIYPAAASLASGETVQLNVFGAQGDVTYSLVSGEGVTVDASGLVTAGSETTEFVIEANDGTNAAQTLTMRVGEFSQGGGGGGGECPFGDPALCQVICSIMPIPGLCP